MRWQDVFGLAGLGLVVLGTILMFPSSTHAMRWQYLVGGSVLWFAGFAIVTGWVAWRWSTAQATRNEERNACPTAERRHSDRRSRRALAS